MTNIPYFISNIDVPRYRLYEAIYNLEKPNGLLVMVQNWTRKLILEWAILFKTNIRLCHFIAVVESWVRHKRKHKKNDKYRNNLSLRETQE